MSDSANAETPAKPRGRPFKKGNPGKPVGARNRGTVALEAIINGQAEAIVAKVVQAALAGNAFAMKLCFARLLGAPRDQPVEINLSEIQSAGDGVKALSTIAQAAATGKISPLDADRLSEVIARYFKALEVHDLDQRVRRLETPGGSK